jgi:hypothetical protein
MTLLWLACSLVLIPSVVLYWPQAEYGVCLSALCLLQSIEERLDAYYDKTARR